MRLVETSPEGYVIEIGRKERGVLLDILRRYPVMPEDYAGSRKQEGSQSVLDLALLQEALAEVRKENRTLLENWMRNEEVWSKHSKSWNLKLGHEEVEWLLQILNDVRIGSWVRLGAPELGAKADLDLKPETIELAWALDMAGFFEQSLIELLAS